MSVSERTWLIVDKNNYKHRCERLQQELSKYKEANKKAIEYIKKQSNKGYNFGWQLNCSEIEYLLKILEGVEDEQNNI